MSIRTRLTFWYTGLLAISLFAFGLVLYSLIEGILIAVLDDRLSAQAQATASLLRTSDRARGLSPVGAFASQYYIQVIGPDRSILELSDNLRGQSLPVPATIGEDLRDNRSRSYTAEIGRGIRLRVHSLPITTNGESTGTVQVGQSLADLDDSLAAIRSTILVGSAASLLLAAVGGVILARAALRPIKAITDTAHQITMAQDLGRRIPITVPSDELGRLSSTINDMLGRLDSLFQAQQRLVADVSHDLRTPLTTIRGNVDLLERGAADDPEMHAAALRAIGEETQRMQRLVNDLLLLAQADSGMQLQMVPVELDTLLLDVYRQAQVTSQGVTVRLGAEDQAMVNGDAGRLRQLLLNLVGNALKYTPAGGQVTLTLRRSDGWVQVAVEDTGVGIAELDLPHIFDRFYRADRSRTRRTGSGLGLSIARWIAQAHGGRIDVSSAIGQGSTFTLWLPDLGDKATWYQIGAPVSQTDRDKEYDAN